jgi:hypothetical protein
LPVKKAPASPHGAYFTFCRRFGMAFRACV